MNHRIELPGPGAEPAALVALGDTLGDETTFNLIRMCRHGTGPATQTRAILAGRLIDAEQRVGGVDRDTARRTVADRLGYTPTTRSNFTRLLDGPSGPGDPGLLRLAEQYGDAAVYGLIVLCRTARGKDPDPGREALTVLARRLVATEQEENNIDYDTARRAVATRLGYTPPAKGNGRANFYHILAGGRAPDRRPHSSRRSARTGR